MIPQLHAGPAPTPQDSPEPTPAVLQEPRLPEAMSRPPRDYLASTFSSGPVDRVDLLVGLMARGGDDRIELPLVKAYEGLTQTYPELGSVVAYCGSDSYAASRKTFQELPSPVPKIWLGTAEGDLDRRHSLVNLMALAKRLQAKVILSVDADLSTVKRTWIGRLAEPIVKGQASLVAPFYHSLKFDTPVTNLLAYPLFRALFGRRLRQPFRADRAFSAELNEIFLAHEGWPEDRPWPMTEMTAALVAIKHGARICQSFMANPRVGPTLPPLDPESGRLFVDVCGPLFELVESHPDMWLKVSRSRPTPVAGTDLTPPLTPPRAIAPPNVFLDRIRELTSLHAGFWSEAFRGARDRLWRTLAEADFRSLSVAPEEWADLVFDAALAHRRLTAPSDPDAPRKPHRPLLRALAHLDPGRVGPHAPPGGGQDRGGGPDLRGRQGPAGLRLVLRPRGPPRSARPPPCRLAAFWVPPPGRQESAPGTDGNRRPGGRKKSAKNLLTKNGP